MVFGMGLPDVKPSFGDMKPRQTTFYYQDGYYYIGLSDFPDYSYDFSEFSVYEEGSDVYAVVKYDIAFEGESNYGVISFIISPEENENGFIIRAKNTEIL